MASFANFHPDAMWRLEMNQTLPAHLRTRWSWLAGVISLCAICLLILWSGVFDDTVLRRDRVTASAVVLALGFLALMVWWMVAVSISVGMRLAGLVGLLGTLGVLCLAVEVGGMTADGVPLLRWSGAAESGTDLPGSHADVWSDIRWSGHGPEPTEGLTAPRRHWRQQIGAGFAGFALAGGTSLTQAITQEQRGTREVTVAYDLRRGTELWAYADSGRFTSGFTSLAAGIGPRSVPVVKGGTVFTLSATGWLRSLAAGDGGHLLWRRRIRETATESGLWAAPLLVRNLIVVSTGTEVHAFAQNSGEPRWQAETPAGDGSLVLTILAGLEQIVVAGRRGASGHDPGTGFTLWQVTWPVSDVIAPRPLAIAGGRLLFNGGGTGARLYDVQRQIGVVGLTPTLLWRSAQLRSSLSCVVEAKGYLYGLDDGRLVCLEATTGFRRWRGAWYGHGQVLLAEGLLIVQSEDGYISLVAAEPTDFVEKLRFYAVDTERGWATPVRHGRWLLVRGNSEAVLWELPQLEKALLSDP
jgi:outer membrane protein assembly factor BamB